MSAFVWIQWLSTWWPLIAVILGYSVGKIIERNHYISIRKREQEFRDIAVLSMRFPPNVSQRYTVQMVSASVVVSADAFKTFIAALRNFFGGSMASYETLLDRARREAILRIKEQAHAQGANLIIGLRYTSNTIANSYTPAVEMMAVGTMLKRL